MSKADYADVESIKNKITSTTIQYRKLGTNMNDIGPNNATFIGASNLKLEHIIKDGTSARRFFQINTLDKLNWQAINEFDYLALWRSVDENQELPYIYEKLPEIERIQQEFKYKYPIEHFISEELAGISTQGDGTRISKKDLYAKYKEWSRECGYTYHQTKQVFFESLSAHIGEALRGRVEGAVSDYYILPNVKK
jgi:hypothetical protein